jgi:hypothetical protein
MDFATLNKQRKFILIAAVLGVISIFLPWLSFSGLSISGFHSYGILVFIGFAGAGVVAVLGDQTKAVDKGMWMAELIAGAISLLFTIIYIMSIPDIGGFGMGYGIGLWIALIASIGVLGSAWFLKSPEDSLQGGFDSLKTKVATAANSNTTTTSSPTNSSKVEELEKLIKLKEAGKISEEEYQELKSKIL